MISLSVDPTSSSYATGQVIGATFVIVLFVGVRDAAAV